MIRNGADKFQIDAQLFIDGEEILGVPLLACYHKPVGVHSAMGEDKWGRENLDKLSLQYPFLKSMHPVVSCALTILTIHHLLQYIPLGPLRC